MGQEISNNRSMIMDRDTQHHTIFHNPSAIVSVKVHHGGKVTETWYEQTWWGFGRDKKETRTYTRPSYVHIEFVDGSDHCIAAETNEEAEAIAAKLKEQYNLIAL